MDMIQVYDGDGIEPLVPLPWQDTNYDLVCAFLRRHAQSIDERDLIEYVKSPREHCMWDAFQGINYLVSRVIDRKEFTPEQALMMRNAVRQWRIKTSSHHGW